MTALRIGLEDMARGNGIYPDFTHDFTMIVTADTVRIYQGWIMQYSLLEWIEGDGARARDRTEFEEFMKAFEILEEPQVRALQACPGVIHY